MSDKQRDGSKGEPFSSGRPSRVQVALIVSRLGAPVFVDMRPGYVCVTCKGVTGVGPDRATAFGALADQFDVHPGT